MSIISEMGLFLAVLVIISTFLRGFDLSTTPPELFGDEIDVGYQARSLTNTGRDMYSQPFPSYIHSLAEWRMPGLIYFTIPTIAVFGNTEIGVRGPEVVFGVLASLILFIFVYRITKSYKLAATSAIVITLSPWHIMYSRSAFEVVIMLDLVMLGILLFYQKRLLLSAIFLCLSMYFYSTAVLIVPLVTILAVIINRKHYNFKNLFKFITLSLILIAPLLYQIFSGPARNRFSYVSIFTDTSLTKDINQLRHQDPSPNSFIWYNKPEALIRKFTSSYLRAFSNDFLFVRGDPTMRHSLQYIGQFYPFMAPLLVFGIYGLIKKRQWLWLGWLVISPLSSALTSDGAYHATRLFFMLVPLSVAFGTGALYLTRLPKLLFGVYVIILTIQIVYAGHYYYNQYPKDSWRWWQVGFKSAFTELDKIESNYSRIFINNTYEPALIRFLFYTNYSPTKFQHEFTRDQPIVNIVPGYSGFSLENKYFFGSFNLTSDGPQNHLMPNSLYLISQRDDIPGDWDWRVSPPTGIKVLSTSVNFNHQPIFYWVSRH